MGQRGCSAATGSRERSTWRRWTNQTSGPSLRTGLHCILNLDRLPTSAQSHTLTSAQSHTLTSAQSHTLTSAQSHTLTSAQSHTLTSAQSHTLTSAQSHTLTSAQSHTLTSAQSHTLTSAQSHTLTSAQSHTLTSAGARSNEPSREAGRLIGLSHGRRFALFNCCLITSPAREILLLIQAKKVEARVQNSEIFGGSDAAPSPTYRGTKDLPHSCPAFHHRIRPTPSGAFASPGRRDVSRDSRAFRPCRRHLRGAAEPPPSGTGREASLPNTPTEPLAERHVPLSN